MGSHDVALQFLREGQRHQFAEPPNDLAAEKAYRSATLTAPEWEEPYHWLGAVFESQGRTKEAVEAYQQAIRLLSADPRHLIALGRLQTTCGHYAEAISLLEAGLALKPHYAEAISYADGSIVTLTWDWDNGLTKIEDTTNGRITRQFDGLDRLKEEVSPQGRWITCTTPQAVVSR